MIGPRGRDLLRRKEDLRLTAYQDERGIWTIGWGHTRGVKEGDTCTREQADAWMVEDLADAEAGVDALVTVELTPAQRDAIVLWTYNLGTPALSESTLLERVNARRWHDAAREFARWDKTRVGGVLVETRGLLIRRLEEAALFAADRWPA